MKGRNPRTLRVAVLVASVLSGTLALATPVLRLGPSPVSSTLYPPQEIRVDFDHADHLGRGLTCVSCHRLAKTSSSPTDNLLPQESSCTGCHSETTRKRGRGGSRTEARCRSCHPQADTYVKRTLIPESQIHFSHSQHNDQECDRCHSRVEVRALATVDDLPGMELCLRCHDGNNAGRRCDVCHITEPDGRLQTHFDTGEMTPPGWMYGAEHEPNWNESHSEVARSQTELCNACHQQHECIACHDGNVRPRDVHPGDWLASHSIEARAGELSCTSCHRGQSFCRTCHLRAGVSWRSPIGRVEGTRNVVHESPNWSAPVAPEHGREARRALQTCVSCHAGNDCVTCHAFVNPHAPGFSNRCQGLVRAGSQSCVACHTSTEGLCGGL